MAALRRCQMPPHNVGPINRECIRRYYMTHVGVSRKECCRALKLGSKTVFKHLRWLREEWKQKDMDT